MSASVSIQKLKPFELNFSIHYKRYLHEQHFCFIISALLFYPQTTTFTTVYGVTELFLCTLLYKNIRFIPHEDGTAKWQNLKCRKLQKRMKATTYVQQHKQNNCTFWGVKMSNGIKVNKATDKSILPRSTSITCKKWTKNEKCGRRYDERWAHLLCGECLRLSTQLIGVAAWQLPKWLNTTDDDKATRSRR